MEHITKVYCWKKRETEKRLQFRGGEGIFPRFYNFARCRIFDSFPPKTSTSLSLLDLWLQHINTVIFPLLLPHLEPMPSFKLLSSMSSLQQASGWFHLHSLFPLPLPFSLILLFSFLPHQSTESHLPQGTCDLWLANLTIKPFLSLP